MSTPPKAFISYSWDDDQHKTWVRDLATQLRRDGVETILDQWHSLPGDHLPSFMERGVRESDFVLIICTPHYKFKSDSRQDGVGFEGYIIESEVFAQQNHRKFIPILRKGKWSEAAPSALLRKYYVDLRDSDLSEAQYVNLLRALHGIQPKAPELGNMGLAPAATLISSEYDNSFSLLNHFGKTCRDLVENLLRTQGIEFYEVMFRVKNHKALAEKLMQKREAYQYLKEMNDAVGIRVIAYSPDEIDQIGTLIEKFLLIEVSDSVDSLKRRELAHLDLSLHYVCSLPPDRLKLDEYEKFNNLRFELQIRSMLEETWGQIRHDLGYKSGGGIHPAVSDRFSYLGELLKQADQEYGAIRHDLRQYESTLRNKIDTTSAMVGIDNISLKVIVNENSVIRGADEEIARGIRTTVSEDNTALLSFLSAGLPLVDISTAELLTAKMQQYKELVIFQALARLKKQPYFSISHGFSVVQLLYVLMGLDGGEDSIVRGIASMGYEPDPVLAREIMERIEEWHALIASSKPRLSF